MYILRIKKGRHICIDDKVKIMIKENTPTYTTLAIECPKEVNIKKSTHEDDINFLLDHRLQLTT